MRQLRDGHTIRISTGKRDLAEAKKYTRKMMPA